MNEMSQDFTQTADEGIAGIKKITFDFSFTYSKGGDEEIGDTIVLKEPSYSELETHARMTSLVTKGLFAAMPHMKDIVDVEDKAVEIKSAGKKSQDRSALFLMSLGMNDKKYIEFVSYVKNLLTNNSRYAFIDGSEVGIADLTWKEIEKEGGKAAIDRVLSEFTSFFIEAMED